MNAKFKIGPLYGGGIVLGYACSSKCRHCLYGSGPHRRDGKPDLGELERLLDTLVDVAPRARYHIGGGEPFLDLDLLRATIEGMVSRRLALEYVETNASWVKNQEQAESVLGDLSDVGLECILVSLSPFHAEFIPFDKTKALIAAARNTLPRGAFPWIPDFLEDITEYPTNKKLDLAFVLKKRGDKYACSLADRYGLVPAGRAGRYLAKHGRVFPYEGLLQRAPCLTRLADTSHFHVDGQGNYVPGLCPGLILPIEELSGPLDIERFPVVGTLYKTDGLRKLVESSKRAGFKPLESYSSPCDLCTHVRKFLFDNKSAPDLGPEGFYEKPSIGDYL